MKNQTKVIIVISISLFIFSVYQFGKLFVPGSYPYAEIYELNATEKKVIEAIQQFKISNSDFIVPNVTINNKGAFNLSESEGRKENAHWNLNYFYFKRENQIVLTWTRPKENNKTDFAFVSINQGLDIGKWKEVNKDFEDSENDKLKAKFEKRILVPIKNTLKDKSPETF